MRTPTQFQRAVTYSKVGLMVLREHFDQRPIKSTYGSFRSLVPLKTPSGAQWTESELETELLEQLAFAPFVFDLITQPTINYEIGGKRRRYTPDIAVQLHATGDDLPSRYLIEVKRREDLERDAEKHALRFEVGRLCADHVGAVFRIMDETRIRTPYLRNARILGRHLLTELNEGEENALDAIRRQLPIDVSHAIALLATLGYAESDARHIIEHALARRRFNWDASVPFCDQTLITFYPQGILASVRNDPLLRLLQDAPDR